MRGKERGFTLMEMVAVIAVIAILASVATPMIFQTIRNARVTTFASDVAVIRSAVAKYYTDTGQFPLHIATDSGDGRQLLLRNGSTRPVAGWNGPYIETQLENPFNEPGYRAVLSTTSADYQFDLDGDGNADTSNVSVLRVDNVGNEEARMLSDIIDNDGDGSWNSAGRVKRYGVNSDHPHVLLIYLAEI